MESINQEVVIGQKIKDVFEGSGIKIGDFADRLGMVRQNVYRIFERTHIDTGLLIRISELLNHDFFQYYTKPTIEKTEDTVYTETLERKATEVQTEVDCTAVVAELSRTKSELELANREIMYLKKIIDLMEERAKWLSAGSK